MARDGDLPTIFHPKRVRTPSVVITSEDIPDRLNGPSQPHTPLTPQLPTTPTIQPELVCSPDDAALSSSGRRCSQPCCSELARKMYFGVCVTVMVTASWVVSTHSIKYLYLKKNTISGSVLGGLPPGSHSLHRNSSISAKHYRYYTYNAPFFTTWFCTNWTILFYPAYLLGRMVSDRCQSPRDVISDCIGSIRDKGFTAARFLTRCGMFCLLWVATTYMYVHALRILLATDAMALFATNVSCVYLLSWVILHEQFVGVRIVAVILCDTGIALLAYMDGITSSPTLGGVVLAASAAAGFAVYKVLLRRVMGAAGGCAERGSGGATALFWSTVGALNATLLWPAVAALYLAGAETLAWRALPWPALLTASGAMLVFNLLTQFGRSVTYELFVTLGLITAVPVSAALDVVLYGANFAGMKLAGMILIAVGFFLVMFPDNWPDYIMRLLRWSRRRGRGRGGPGGSSGRGTVDYRTGYIRSHLRSPSGRVR